jgi:hypothetical protein
MTDHSHSSHSTGSDPHGGFDSEIDVRRILEIGAWLAAITIGALIIGYFIYKGLGRHADKADPVPSPLPEASRPVEPPAPRLQATPELELAALRKAADERLGTWGWVDRSTGIAHIPIDLAIASLAVPEPAPAAPAASTATPEAPAADPAHAPETAGPAGSAGSGH